MDNLRNFSAKAQRIITKHYSQWADVSYELKGAGFFGQYGHPKMKVHDKTDNSFMITYEDDMHGKHEVLVPQNYNDADSNTVKKAIDDELGIETKYHWH